MKHGRRLAPQALRKSLLEVQRVVHEAPGAPVCHPTEEEWRDFYSYIETISPLGLAHGIVKIVPPPGMRDSPNGECRKASPFKALKAQPSQGLMG